VSYKGADIAYLKYSGVKLKGLRKIITTQVMTPYLWDTTEYRNVQIQDMNNMVNNSVLFLGCMCVERMSPLVLPPEVTPQYWHLMTDEYRALV